MRTSDRNSAYVTACVGDPVVRVVPVLPVVRQLYLHLLCVSCAAPPMQVRLVFHRPLQMGSHLAGGSPPASGCDVVQLEVAIPRPVPYSCAVPQDAHTPRIHAARTLFSTRACNRIVPARSQNLATSSRCAHVVAVQSGRSSAFSNPIDINARAQLGAER